MGRQTVYLFWSTQNDVPQIRGCGLKVTFVSTTVKIARVAYWPCGGTDTPLGEKRAAEPMLYKYGSVRPENFEKTYC